MGVKVFNREPRVEGEHGRKRRRNAADEVVTSEVDPIVPERLWDRVQSCWLGGESIAWHPSATRAATS